jgi:hypothetical protein
MVASSGTDLQRLIDRLHVTAKKYDIKSMLKRQKLKQFRGEENSREMDKE